MPLNIGIDFGTSTLYVTRWNETQRIAEPIPNITRDQAEKFIDNVIYYESISNQIIGKSALRRGITHPQNYVDYVKRKIDDAHENWSTFIDSLNKELTVEDIITDIFKHLKLRIEELHAGDTIDNVVISVPYAFQDKERKIIKNSAIKAGLNVKKLIEEPVAAAISYGVFYNNTHQFTQRESLLVFDFGGGTVDVTLFEIKPAKNQGLSIEVINTDGEKYLGGKDIDDIVYQKLIEQIQKQNKCENVVLSKKNQHKLLEEAKRIKENLSEMEEDEAYLVFDKDSDSHDYEPLDVTITLKQFNDWLKESNLISKIEEVLNRTFNPDIVDIEPKNLDKVLLVGGSSNIRLVQDFVQEYLGQEGIYMQQDPAEMVGCGAGIYCGSLVDQSLNYNIIDKINSSIGIKAENNRFDILVRRNTSYNKYTPSKQYILPRNVNKFIVRVYQGTSSVISENTHNEIGVIKIDNPEKYQGGRFRLQLGTDNSGLVLYRLLDIGQNVIQEGSIENN